MQRTITPHHWQTKAESIYSAFKFGVHWSDLHVAHLVEQLIENQWVVGSKQQALEVGKLIAATLARMVSGKVRLIFFDGSAGPAFDVTGKSMDEIRDLTRRVGIGSATSIGAGLDYALQQKWECGGIALITDGEHNTSPRFSDVYKKYSERMGCDPTIYYYHCFGGADFLSWELENADVAANKFEVARNADSYSIINMAQTMRTNRYSLIDEIMATPLKTLDEVFKTEKKEEPEYVEL